MGGDCSLARTNPDPSHALGGLYELKLVVHVIENETGSAGFISDGQIEEQIRLLNADFRALPGSAAEQGVDAGLTFSLAKVDPEGNPTSGITRHQNDAWFDDTGAYWDELAWDPQRFINLYTNGAEGLLGYAFMPADPASDPGAISDRVVIHWQYIGREQDDPTRQGRTATHELGHYLGLDHPFAPNPTTPETFICAPSEPPECYESGDLICDTPSEDSANESCEPRATCGSPDAIENFMDYTPDACMDRFSPEQVLRMRCSVLTYRPRALWPAARLRVVELPREMGLARLSAELWNDSPLAQRFSLSVDGTASATFHPGPAPPNGVELEPAESRRFELTVDLSDAGPVTDLTFEATSDLNEHTAVESVGLLKNPQPWFALSSELDRIHVSAESPANFRLDIANHGVVAETFELDFEGAWPAVPSSGSNQVEVEAQQAASVEVTLTLPAAVRARASAALIVSARSLRAPDVRRSLELEAVAERWVAARLTAFTSTLQVLPGQSGRALFALENLGNDAETFALTLATDADVTARLRGTSVGPLAAFAGDGPVDVVADFEVDDRAEDGEALSLRLDATPFDAAARGSAEVTLEVMTTGRITLAPRLDVREAEIGQRRDFSFTVQNQSDRGDEVEISLDSEAELLVAPPARLELAARQQASFELALALERAIPSTSRLRVASRAHPNRMQSAEIVLIPAGSPDAARDTTGGRCDAGSSCPTTPARTVGCACGATRTPAGASTGLIALALLVLVRWRRRNASPQIGSIRDQSLELAIGNGQHGQVDASGCAQLGHQLRATLEPR